MKMSRGGYDPTSVPLDPDELVASWANRRRAELVASHVHDEACGTLWCPDPPKPPRRRFRLKPVVRFVGITAAGAVIAFPIWWTLWHAADKYLGHWWL